ncbi:FliM/FliN family flagellar motor switch protein [Candidatus Latescibacterota bacterium]
MTDQQCDRTWLANVPLDVTVELGRKEISLGEARRLQEGDVIAFDKLAGEAFDLMVNGRVFAESEVVVVHDLMAVRITRLINREFEVSV